METSSGKSSGMDPIANTTSFDVVIIGAGIVGAAAFRELCKYDLKVLLLDSLHDVGGDASRANSASPAWYAHEQFQQTGCSALVPVGAGAFH